jgi:hypothetical protein
MTDHANKSLVPNAQTNADIIRDLNDRFRKLQSGGTLMATPSIMDMGPHAVHAIMTLALSPMTDTASSGRLTTTMMT